MQQFVDLGPASHEKLHENQLICFIGVLSVSPKDQDCNIIRNNQICHRWHYDELIISQHSLPNI